MSKALDYFFFRIAEKPGWRLNKTIRPGIALALLDGAD